MTPLAPRWEAFGWDVVSVDGHDDAALDEALARAEASTVPAVVLARTVKGKGVKLHGGRSRVAHRSSFDARHFDLASADLGPEA